MEDILQNYIPELPIYTSIVFEENEVVHSFNKSIEITQEGVYYTIIIFSREEEDRDRFIREQDTIFADPSTYQISDKDPYISVDGTLIYANTFGYLNAERYPLIMYYAVTAGVLTLVCFIWLCVCFNHRSQLIFIHHFISIILASQLIQALFMIVELYIINVQGTLVFSFILANIMFSICRNLFARVLTLLVALGFGIVITPEAASQKYKTKIIILSSVYIISNAVYLIVI